jgi:hypothetical protein
MGDEWKSLDLPLPKGAKICTSSPTHLSIAGVGRVPDLTNTVLDHFKKIGFVLDDEDTAQSTGTMLSVGLRKGLYGVNVIVDDDEVGYLIELSSITPYEKWLKSVRDTGGPGSLEFQVTELVKESGNRDKDFWRDMRGVFSADGQLPLRSSYARRDVVDRAYRAALADPADLLAQLDQARTQNLTSATVVEFHKADDPRMSPLLATMKDAYGDTTLYVVELRPAGAKPSAPASLVIGPFVFDDGQHHGYTYIGPAAAYKDGAITEADTIPRAAAARAAKRKN